MAATETSYLSVLLSHLQLVIDQMPSAVYVCEAPTGIIRLYNRRAVDSWGRAPRLGDSDERFCGSFRLFRPDGRPLPHAETPMAEALTGGSAHDEEVIIERPDGSRRPVRVNIAPLRDPDGNIIGAINAFQDIADERQIETAARLAAIVESSDDAIVGKTLDGIITSWNRSAERIFGYTAAEAVGQPITLIIPAERRAEEDDIIARLRRGERIDHFETERQPKHGQPIHVSLTVSPVHNAEGRIVGASKVARDITGRKEAERMLAALRDRLGADLAGMRRLNDISTRLIREDTLPDLLREILDAAIQITRADLGTLQLLDRSSGVLSIAAQRGFAQASLDGFTTRPTDVAAGGPAWPSERRVTVEDVATHPLFTGTRAGDILLAAGATAVQSTPLVGRSGELVGMLSTYHRSPRQPDEHDLPHLVLLARQAADLIEHQLAAQALRESQQAEERARSEAEEANRAKDDFLATLSHELRTPLHAMLGWLRMLRAGTLDAVTVERGLEVVERNVNHQARLITDLLDISRIISICSISAASSRGS